MLDQLLGCDREDRAPGGCGGGPIGVSETRAGVASHGHQVAGDVFVVVGGEAIVGGDLEEVDDEVAFIVLFDEERPQGGAGRDDDLVFVAPQGSR